MTSAVRNRLEALLDARKLGGTLQSPWDRARRPAVLPTGLPAVDEALGGGWRQGEISEVVGGPSTGRTSVLVASLARATATGGVAAVVDAVDRLDPASLAAGGVDLDRVLWIRGAAITIEAARRPLVEDVITRAVRAFDLVLRAGGFTLVALDVADIRPRDLRALPWTTWRRLAHANEGRPTAGLIVGQEPMARSARGQSLRLDRRTIWTGDSPQSRKFDGFNLGAIGASGASGALGAASALST
jgi:hypothetical protein